jgi:hypothetical protein
VRVTIAPRAEDPEAFYSWSADTEQQVNQENLPEDGGRQVIEAQYLVGCDGGKSLVRESMGIDRGGRNFDQRMVLAVFRSRELHEALKRFPESTTYRVMKPELEGYWQFFGRIDVGEGWFFHAPVPEGARVDTFDFVALLHEAAGFPFHAELEHVGFWDLRIAVASQYRKGRVFIAGDACHQHPPYGIRRRRHRKSACLLARPVRAFQSRGPAANAIWSCRRRAATLAPAAAPPQTAPHVELVEPQDRYRVSSAATHSLRFRQSDPSARLPCCGLRGTARPIVVVDPWIVRGECVGLNDRDAVAFDGYRHRSSVAT